MEGDGLCCYCIVDLYTLSFTYRTTVNGASGWNYIYNPCNTFTCGGSSPNQANVNAMCVYMCVSVGEGRRGGEGRVCMIIGLVLVYVDINILRHY